MTVVSEFDPRSVPAPGVQGAVRQAAVGFVEPRKSLVRCTDGTGNGGTGWVAVGTKATAMVRVIMHAMGNGI